MKRKREGINKRGLVLAVSEKTYVTQCEVKHIIQCFIDELEEQYRNNKAIELRGFGTFYPHHKDAYTFTIPKGGGTRQMPGRTILRFKPSPRLYIND